MRLNTRVCAALSGRTAPWRTGRPEQAPPLLKGGFGGIVCAVYCTRPGWRSDLVPEYPEHRAAGLLLGEQVARNKSPFSKGDLGGLSVRCIARARRGVRI